MANMPAAEVDISAALVLRLISEQHPDLAGRSLTAVAHGWDNVIFRLGDDLAVRLPRRQAAAELIRNEQRWLPELSRGLMVGTPHLIPQAGSVHAAGRCAWRRPWPRHRTTTRPSRQWAPGSSMMY